MKTITSVFFFCLFAVAVQAQVSVGVKGGFTRAWQDYGDVQLPEDAETDIAGYNVSLLANYRISKFLSVGVAPGLVQRGAACVPGWQPIFEGDTKFFLQYAELPVMINADIPLISEKLTLTGSLGYGASAMVSAYREAEIFILPVEPPTRTPMEIGGDSFLNRWDHGAYANLALGYQINRHRIFLESGYYMGMVDADRFNTSKNRSLNFNVGYMISL